MSSNKQLQANRANAKKSTGPKTQAGKDRSRLNSRKHGLTAKTLIIFGECADDFERLRAELMDEHDPQSALEFELLEHLAVILWRLRRVPSFEAAILDARRAKVEAFPHPYLTHKDESFSEQEWHARSLGGALISDGCSSDALGKVSRYETSLMNSLAKTLLLLQRVAAAENANR